MKLVGIQDTAKNLIGMQFAIVENTFVAYNKMYIPNDFIIGASLLRFVYTKEDFKKYNVCD